MVNFEKLVEAVIFEQVQTNAPFALFYADSTELGDIRTFFAQTFSIQQIWPNSSSTFPILQDTYVRPRAESLVPFAENYPLIDFVWYIVDKNQGKTNVLDLSSSITFDLKSMKNLEQSFLNACKKNNPGTNLNPLFGYSPISTKAVANQKPLQRKISNSLIGKLSLDAFNNLSIRKALYGILENRKKVRSSVLKNKNIPNAIKWIDGILQDPKKYAGQKQIPTQIKSLYDGVTGEALIEIAQTMHDFFDAEASATAQQLLGNNSKTVTNEFMEFAANQPLQNNAYVFKFQPSGLGISPHLSKTPGGYTIQNIKKINTPQAKALINILTDFASFVSEGEPRDWAGIISGVSQIAQGLKGLGGTMGR
jgi:hypothetical protein